MAQDPQTATKSKITITINGKDEEFDKPENIKREAASEPFKDDLLGNDEKIKHSITTRFAELQLAYGSDRDFSVREIDQILKYYNTEVKVVKLSSGQGYSMYAAGDSYEVFKIAVYPFEFVVTFNTNGTITLQVFVTVPFFGSINIGQVSGSKEEGFSVTVTYLAIVNGTVGIKLVGTDLVLYWDVNAFGLTVKDSVVLL